MHERRSKKKKELKASNAVCDLCWLVDVREIDGCRRSFCGVGLVLEKAQVIKQRFVIPRIQQSKGDFLG
ncbi:hypothetical protein CMV_011041 [Castanea mollissima]|uniref:Uncharacterized protein n=1 Tax=Castanea mollissima TaxID=60419 RepID=A0A8J4VX93_9ROSI|nr:hypothetical protein CMV_011041 [Castanea mollissima]